MLTDGVTIISVFGYRRLTAYYKSYKISYILKIVRHLLYIYFRLWVCDNGQFIAQSRQ